MNFLLHKINFHWRVSMSVNIFPLEVFDVGVSCSSIVLLTNGPIFQLVWHRLHFSTKRLADDQNLSDKVSFMTQKNKGKSPWNANGCSQALGFTIETLRKYMPNIYHVSFKFLVFYFWTFLASITGHGAIRCIFKNWEWLEK